MPLDIYLYATAVRLYVAAAYGADDIKPPAAFGKHVGQRRRQFGAVGIFGRDGYYYLVALNAALEVGSFSQMADDVGDKFA